VALYDPYRDAYGLDATARAALQTGVDYSGRGNSLTYGANTNASTDDPTNTGTAWSLDGGDYVQVADTAKLVITGPFTLMTVFKSVTGTQVYNRILGKEGLFMLYWSTGTGYLLFTGNIGGGVLDTRPSLDPTKADLTLNTVNVASISYDGAGLTGYVNGVAIGAPYARTGAVKSDTPVPLTIGNRTAVDRGLKGNVYMGGVWERALSGAEQLRAYRYLKSLMAGRGVTVA